MSASLAKVAPFYMRTDFLRSTGVNSLMAEVLEDHIRLHMMGHEKSAMPSAELAEDLIGLVRAYLK